MSGNWRGLYVMDLKRIPNTPGVYMLRIDGAVAYIGCSCNVRARIKGHRICRLRDGTFMTPWGPAGYVALKVRRCRRYGEHLMREARLIRRLRPRFNKAGAAPRRVPRVKNAL